MNPFQNMFVKTMLNELFHAKCSIYREPLTSNWFEDV